MSSDWIEGMCNEKTGFLFRHPCDRYPQNRCDACNKPICPDHERPLEEGMILCVACYRAETRRRGLSIHHHRRYDDDPYYYGGTYYPGYGHYYGSGLFMHGHSHGSPSGHADPNDLNAGDAESLKNEDDEDFETDMGES